MTSVRERLVTWHNRSWGQDGYGSSCNSHEVQIYHVEDVKLLQFGMLGWIEMLVMWWEWAMRHIGGKTSNQMRDNCKGII
jgi:hypothetical protein